MYKYFVLVVLLVLSSCDEVFDEVRLAGGTWKLKSVSTVEYLTYSKSSSKRTKDESWKVEDGVLSYQINSDGTFLIRSTEPTLFGGAVYEDWSEGKWTYKDSILCMSTQHGTFTYRLESLFKDKLVLFYSPDRDFEVRQRFERNDK